MEDRLIKPYEISVWEEALNGERFEEKKLAVIGSNTMTGLNKVYNPVFHKKDNGEKTLSFSLKYKYFDPYSGSSDVINPFVGLLTNERKVKLHYDNEWYEFIIKDHSESSDEYEWTYTCTDAFVLELSKTGYNITFDQELNNNQGTARELATETLKNTDWRLGAADVGPQLVAEPIYKATLVNGSENFIINASNNEEAVPTSGDIYLFYSYVKNKDGKNVQFIIRSDSRKYTIDDKNVITDTNFRITIDLVYNDGIFEKEDGTPIIIINKIQQDVLEIENRYQANRLVYKQYNTYDPVMQRTVDLFKAGDREIYRYIDYLYTTSNIVMNFITNGENFNTLEDGTLQGWNPYVDSKKTINKLELVTYPELGLGQKLIDLDVLTQIDGFLKVQFNGAKLVEDGKVYELVYNSGFQNNSSSIESVAKGDKFVFRWRAGQRDSSLSEEQSDLEKLAPAKDLRAIVATYTQDDPTRYGYYYKHVNESDIIMEFTPEDANDPRELNNVVEGGEIRDNYVLTSDKEVDDEKTYYSRSDSEPYVYTEVENPTDEGLFEYYELRHIYVINDVVQEISTKYIYKDAISTNKYVWDREQRDLVLFTEDNYLPYYYLTTTAQKAVPNNIITDPTVKIGIFIYNTTGEGTYYIQDIQLTRYIPGGVNEEGKEVPILIGNIPTATSTQTEHYYLKPGDGTAAEDVQTYTSANELVTDLDISDPVEPVYNVDSEKYLSISASKSNCFDILQNIAETFECWIDLVVAHDESGAITYDADGRPNKFVYLREYAGDENYAGFRYGINLKSIERTVNSEEVVTKLIVDQSQSENTDEGYVSIALAPSNMSGESYILNFDYYYSQGLLDRETVEEDRLKFASQVAELNNEIKTKEKQKRDLEASMTALGSKRNVFTELIDTAKENKSEALGDFEKLTNTTYTDYQEERDAAIEYSGELYIVTSDEEVEEGKKYYTYDGEVFTEVTEPSGDPSAQGYYEILPDYTAEETVLDTIGKLYVSSMTINNYSGLLINIDQEYWKVRKELRGSENYNVKVWTNTDDNSQRHICVELNDYLPGFKFELENDTTIYESTVSRKYFDLTSAARTITFYAPSDYSVEQSVYEINDSKIVKFKITSSNTIPSIADEIQELQDQKDELTKNFNNKYARFIQEGTWNSTDYIDNELYYLDALQVSNTSAQPTVEYQIDVVEISELEGFEWYLFDAGDKSYVEDTEFFGWKNVNGVLTPAREEVIVAEVEWHLDEPDKNTITVKNYKTRFEDLFQRISATVQTVQYNEATYAKISSLLDANGTINQDVFLEAMNNLAGKEYALTSDGSIIVEEDAILVRNLNNSANRVIINSEGIRISSDGGVNWTTAIDGQGINIGVVYTGSLNTNEVIIGNKDHPSFRWDKAGISAFKSTGQDAYDLQTYVRFDEYGLYGIKDSGSFKAQSLMDIKDSAHFAVTWDGFFIKNSYEDGGRVSITSDNDFQVTKKVDNNEQEVIKIGMLEQGINGNLYGMRIKGTDNNNVFVADSNGNLSITGEINAESGTFSGLVNVGTGNPYIEIDGENAVIKSSLYQAGPAESATRGWMINAEGDAVFNNITARGSIKTAVFEYAEIQAVGGVFIFRPSSTIKYADVDESDLIVKVDNPLLFAENDWCKVSNYVTDSNHPSPVAATAPNGLSYIYKVTNVNTTDSTVTLEDAAAMVEGEEAITTKEELIGGALVSMGNTDGKSNYGIGINSSDNTVNLPRRSISLFETEIKPQGSQKVTYNYRGILGTLPEDLSGVDDTVYKHMQTTQGIYTDNMYIGGANKYLAFYTEGNDKKLRIKASEIFFEGDNHEEIDIKTLGESQHFWFKTEGDTSFPAGAYVTNTKIDTFKEDKTGGYLLVRSDGLELGKDLIPDAVLNANGLTINNGSIILGNTESTDNGSVALSNSNFGRKINNIQINDLRLAIGSKFGVQNDGTLYASGAVISGAVEITGGDTYEQINNIDNNLSQIQNLVKIDGSTISIGDPEHFHIFIDGTTPQEEYTYGLGFYHSKHNPYDLTTDKTVQADTVYYKKVDNEYVVTTEEERQTPGRDPQNSGWYVKTDKRVAYINENKLSIPYTVVLRGMELGAQWRWELNESTENLTLKWLEK